MASGYTANYGLCQWQPEDKFLREEFNQDNEKIDAALGEAATMARRCDEALPLLSYDLNNLMLQQYYEGKYMGWKKGMLFDSFMDMDGIGEKSEGLWWTSGMIRVETQGIGNEDSTRRDTTLEVASSKTWDNHWSVTGNGTLKAVTVYAQCVGADRSTVTTGTAKLEILLNGQVLATSPVVTVSGSFTGTRFPMSCELSVNNTYTMRYTAVTTGGSVVEGYHQLQTSSSTDFFAYSLECTPRPSTTAWMHTPLYDLEIGYDRVLAWVRYRSGAAPKLLWRRSQEEEWKAMIQGESRSISGVTGTTGLTETAFSLDGTGGPGASLRIELTGNIQVVEYGVVVL